VNDPTYRLTEIVGTSGESLEAAIRNGIGRAAKTLHGLDWFEVSEIRGAIENGNPSQFQVTMKVGFKVDE
jgi:dodecin